ncbi:unnamed protein product [Brugia timori]|uniref:Uncharacterized protein n=1 Tax=Brugia timori TaxID=42155 RepID=A0A0R3QXD5_9BILA|nr:unnamed protein product [Brugia timori]
MLSCYYDDEITMGMARAVSRVLSLYFQFFFLILLSKSKQKESFFFPIKYNSKLYD